MINVLNQSAPVNLIPIIFKKFDCFHVLDQIVNDVFCEENFCFLERKFMTAKEIPAYRRSSSIYISKPMLC